MVFMEEKAKDFLTKYLTNLAKGCVPTPFTAIIDTILECKSDEELKLKFDQLKKHAEEYANRLQRAIPTIPISVEAEYATIVVLYFLIEPKHVNFLLDTDQFKIELEALIAESDLIGDYEVYSDCIILQSPDVEISKEEWQNIDIKLFRDTLYSEFEIKIKSILYI
jgi:hypothetical protein